MAKQIINTGTTANSKNGDPLRSAFTKVNNNFTELYSRLEIPSVIGNDGKFLYTNGSVLTWEDPATATTIAWENVIGRPSIPTDVNELTDVDNLLSSGGGSLGNFTLSVNTLSVNNTSDLTIQSNNDGAVNIVSHQNGYTQLEWSGSHNNSNYIWVEEAGTTIENDGKLWQFTLNGNLTFPSGALIIADSLDGTYLQANPGVDGYAGISNLTGSSWMWTANDGGAYISTNAGSWTFGADGNTSLPGTLSVTGETTLTNTTINGVFTLNGETQYIVSENAVYTDNLLEIHAPSGGVGESWTTNDGKDIGIRMHYYNGTADKNAALFMDNGDWTLKWVVDGTESNGQFTHSGFGNIQANTFIGGLQGNATTATTATSATTATNANNINISTTNGNSSDTTLYPVLVGSSSTGNQLPHTDTSGLSYNASNNTLTASTFNGALSGNADTASRATDVAGGGTNQILYQSSVNNTSFINAPTNNTHLTYTTGGGFAWSPTNNNITTGTNNSVTVGNLVFSYSSNQPRVSRSGENSQTLIGSYYTIIGNTPNQSVGRISITAGSGTSNLGGTFTTTGDTAVYNITNDTDNTQYRVTYMRLGTSTYSIVVEKLI